ncbi:MAG: hypothetical protein AB1405_04840 [Bdellovibrionota bacterium]
MFYPFWFMFRGKTQAVTLFEELPESLREPCAFGMGLILCEGGIPIVGAILEQVSALKAAMTPFERDAVERGCQMGTRLREGTVRFRALAWPLEAEAIDLSSCQMVGGWEHFRTPPVWSPRPAWPWSDG